MEKQNVEERTDELDIVAGGEPSVESSWTYEENLTYAKEHIFACLGENRKLMKKFKSKEYENAFMEYVAFCRPVFEAMDRAYAQEPDKKEEIFDQTISAFLEGVDKDAKKISRLQRMNHLDESKFVLALFFVPAVDYMKLSVCDEWIDCFIERWIAAYPKCVFKRGTYELLMDGFRKKRYCYVTTAVCETMGKEDNCYELAMFRAFRDGYLLAQEDGQALIEQYYREAPMIVNAIDELPNCNEVYYGIWEKYLAGCLKDIEDNREQDCKIHYTQMIEELKEMYL